jgi:hypothetical protein
VRAIDTTLIEEYDLIVLGGAHPERDLALTALAA